jgi:hypothetical protein
VHLPGSSPVSSAFPTLMSGRLPASFRERDFSRGKFSRLQLFRYVQASELACLPDRSYRCRFPRRAAEAFTSEQNVRRCLRTHRICSPPDYRQLAARGLSPREIHSIVDCSVSVLPSSVSAGGPPLLFDGLAGTLPLYDSPLSGTWVLWLIAFSHRPATFPLQAAAESPGSRAWSFYACLGSTDSAEWRRACHSVRRLVVFRVG